MDASWRSWPRSTATNCAVLPAPGRSRRWWPGRPARHRITPNTIAAVAHRLRGVSPLRGGHAGGPAVARSGRRHREASRPTDPMSTTRNWPPAPRSASCAPPSSSNRAPNPVNPSPIGARAPAGTSPFDHQDRQRGVHHLADHPPARRSGDVRLPPLQSHHDALIAHWKRDHGTGDADGASDQAPPLPNTVDAFISLIEAGWDTDVARRPHGQRTTVIVHLDVEARLAALHLGPLLSEHERRYLLCDATCEVWFERDGQGIGSGRETRLINRRLRRALEYRDRCCVVPGCGATRGLHAHHIRHWEDGGPTELDNLVLVCPYHHRLHHRGVITITGTARHLVGHRQHRPATARGIAGPPPDDPPTRGHSPARALPANGPTGGGMSPSSRNHHRQPTNGSSGRDARNRPPQRPPSRPASCTSPTHPSCRPAAAARIRPCATRTRPCRRASRACLWRRRGGSCRRP